MRLKMWHFVLKTGSSSDQNPRFTSLSEMTSIPDLSHESPRSPPHTPFHMGVSPHPHTRTHLFTWGSLGFVGV